MEDTKLRKLSACEDARTWVFTQRNYKEAWQNCERGDWMLWLAKRLKVDDRKLTLAKFKCANQVRHLMKDQRSLDALDAAERYGNGEISRDELIAAADAAYAAARLESLKKSADFCREILTEEVLTAYAKLR